MIKETLIQIYTMDLKKVIGELEKYESEEDIWKLAEGINNSGGTLALHLIGNIKHYFGKNLGETDFMRQRDQEFSDKNISRDKMIGSLEETIQVLKKSLDNLSDEDFQEDYPELLGETSQTNFEVVIYMLSHLNQHLGQINYHRRLVAK